MFYGGRRDFGTIRYRRLVAGRVPVFIRVEACLVNTAPAAVRGQPSKVYYGCWDIQNVEFVIAKRPVACTGSGSRTM